MSDDFLPYGFWLASLIGVAVYYVLPEEWWLMLGLLMLTLVCAAAFGLMVGVLIEEFVAFLRGDDER